MTDFKSGKRCYHDHPPLPLDDGKVIYGGNGEFPAIDDAEIYVALDYAPRDSKFFPWHNQAVLVPYRMTDGQPPSDKAEFKNLIQWLSEQIDAGKKVHVGCIGGHGRTGTVLAALVAYRKISDDPIKYVRENYCKKAVETKAQVEYLVEEWGCKEHPGSYTLFPRSGGGQSKTTYHGGQGELWKGTSSSMGKPIYSSESGGSSKNVIDSGSPMRDQLCIWSQRVTTTVGVAE